MSLQKIGRQIMMLLKARGVSDEVLAATDMLYCFRRLFPSLAHRSGFNEPELLDVGGWNDPAAKQRNAMPRLYRKRKAPLSDARRCTRGAL